MNYSYYLLIAAMCLAGSCAPVDQQRRSDLSAQQTSGKELDKQLDVLTSQIFGNLTVQRTTKVAVVEFSDLDGKVSPLGKYLAEELTTRLFRVGKFQIIERKLLDKMLEEQKLSASGLIDQKTAQAIGMILGVDAITTGTVADLNTFIKINARLIAPQTGSVFAVASVTVPVEGEIELLLKRGPRAGSGTDTGRFDGTWDVTLICPTHTDGALGYTYEFQTRVKDGVLSGQYGDKGSPGSLTLSGTIKPDGSSLMDAHGITGNPKYSVDRVQKNTPYSYHVAARFEGSRGTGSRVELRICNLTFVRQ